MTSRFWRAGGNALLPGSNTLGNAVAGTVWNGSADTPPSKADWTRSTDHLTITGTAATTFHRPAYGNIARVSGTIDSLYVAT